MTNGIRLLQGATLIFAAGVFSLSATANDWVFEKSSESYLNLEAFPADVARFENRILHNNWHQERAWFGWKKEGFLFSEYLVHGVFNEETSYDRTDDRYLRRYLKRYYERRKAEYEIKKIDTFRLAGRRGHHAVVSVSKKIRNCFHSVSGYKFNTHTLSQANVYDTLVWVRYCDYEISDEMRGKLVDFITHMSLNE